MVKMYIYKVVACDFPENRIIYVAIPPGESNMHQIRVTAKIKDYKSDLDAILKSQAQYRIVARDYNSELPPAQQYTVDDLTVYLVPCWSVLISLTKALIRMTQAWPYLNMAISCSDNNNML